MNNFNNMQQQQINETNNRLFNEQAQRDTDMHNLGQKKSQEQLEALANQADLSQYIPAASSAAKYAGVVGGIVAGAANYGGGGSAVGSVVGAVAGAGVGYAVGTILQHAHMNSTTGKVLTCTASALLGAQVGLAASGLTDLATGHYREQEVEDI